MEKEKDVKKMPKSIHNEPNENTAGIGIILGGEGKEDSIAERMEDCYQEPIPIEKES